MSHRMLGIALIGLTSAACADAPITRPATETVVAAAPGGNAGPSVNGQVGYFINGELQNTAFNARILRDGRVVGQLQNKSRGQDHSYHGVVDCLVVDGNTARIGGVITSARNEDGASFVIQEGTRFWLGVADGGEGANAAADQFTDVFVNIANPDFGCRPLAAGYLDAAHGQVQVKP